MTSLPPLVFKPAVRAGVPLLLVFAGASGTGKTRSALRVALGIAGDMAKVFVADTENRRALFHVEAFDTPFMHAPMDPPFPPARFIGALQQAQEAGAAVLLIDSFSDEWEGEGGMLDMAGDGENAAKWKMPKAEHKRFIREVRQSPLTVILCLRAEDKIAMVPNPQKPGRTMVVHKGWTPVCEKRLTYDASVLLTMNPETPGAVALSLPNKIPDVLLGVFPDGALITEETGAILKRWASGEIVKQPQKKPAETKRDQRRPPPRDERRDEPPAREERREPPPKEEREPTPEEVEARAKAEANAQKARDLATVLIGRFNATTTRAEHLAIVDADITRKQMEWFRAKRRDLFDDINAASKESWRRTEPQAKSESAA
jgi:hypothetical protein